MKALLLAFTFLLLTISVVAQESAKRVVTVMLSDGGAIKGQFTGADKESLTLDSSGVTSTIPLDKVKSIIFESTSPAANKIPTDGKALVYFYREPFTKTLGKVTAPVYCDDVKLATIDVTRYFVARFDPGPHKCRSSDKGVKPLELDLRPDGVYYILVSVKEGLFSLPGRLTPLTAEQGAMLITSARPIDRSDIKDKKRVVVEVSEP